MTAFYKKGEVVFWKWGSGEAQGKIEEIHKKTFEKTIKGSKIKKNGNEDNPAYLIVQENKSQVIKLHSELIDKTDN